MNSVQNDILYIFHITAPVRSNSNQSLNSSSKYNVGDDVMITKDLATTKILQHGHGGWNDAMNTVSVKLQANEHASYLVLCV